MSRSGQEDLPDVREWSVGPPGCPEIVLIPYRMFARTSRIFGSGLNASRMSGSGREALPDVREWS